jgi:hypothetical protein
MVSGASRMTAGAGQVREIDAAESMSERLTAL